MDLVGANPTVVVVVNTELGSAADEAGFRAGDVTLEVNVFPRQFNPAGFSSDNSARANVLLYE